MSEFTGGSAEESSQTSSSGENHAQIASDILSVRVSIISILHIQSYMMINCIIMYTPYSNMDVESNIVLWM
jgi:hypothetical protein